MTDPTTNNLLLAIPTHGSDVDVWDAPLNSNSTAIDGFLGGVATIALSNSNVTLTSPAGTVSPAAGSYQAQNRVLIFTGVLTASVIVTLPFPGEYTVVNNTTGAFVVTFSAVNIGNVIATPQGSTMKIYSDGTNVGFIGMQEPGSYKTMYISGALPAWMLACTISPYLVADGSTFNGTIYANLKNILGGTTLPDLRGRALIMLDTTTAQGPAGRVTTAGSGVDGTTIGSAGGIQNESLVLGNLPQFTPSGSVSTPVISQNGATQGGVSNVSLTVSGGSNFNLVNGTTNIVSVSSTPVFTGTPIGSATPTPVTVLQPSLVGGLILIKT